MRITPSNRPTIWRHAVLTAVAWTTVLGYCAVMSDRCVAQEISGLQAAAAIEQVLIDVIARNEKSVVAVFQHRQRQGIDHPLGRLQPDPSGLRNPAEHPDFIPTRFATGVIIDRSGLVLTNYHVLDINPKGYDVTHYVTTIERKVYRASIKAADPRSDLAVLQLHAPGQGTIALPPIKFGTSNGLKKGSLVITLGNPYGIAQDGQASAGWGIVANLSRKAGPVPNKGGVSGFGRSTLHHYGTLIQTDARLNLGTSGGPLLNLKGEMVGLTTSIAAQVGYEKSAGYAIPVNATFLRAVETLKQGHRVDYGFLGIETKNLTSAQRHAGMTGMRVQSVFPGSPAKLARSPSGAEDPLLDGDVVTHVDGRPIHDSNGLVLNVGQFRPEYKVRLRVIRDNQVRQIQARLTKFPVSGHIVATSEPPPWRGLQVDYPTAVLPIQRLGAIPVDCVAIRRVERYSPAAKQGLQRGMLITHVGSQPVTTPDEFRTAVRGKTGPVVIHRRLDNGRSVSTTLKAPPR